MDGTQHKGDVTSQVTNMLEKELILRKYTLFLTCGPLLFSCLLRTEKRQILQKTIRRRYYVDVNNP